MDAIELEQMPKALRVMLLQLADFVEAGMKNSPENQILMVGEPCYLSRNSTDAPGIGALLRRSFESDAKRSWFTICGRWFSTLGLVLRMMKAVQGYVAFSPVTQAKITVGRHGAAGGR